MVYLRSIALLCLTLGGALLWGAICIVLPTRTPRHRHLLSEPGQLWGYDNTVIFVSKDLWLRLWWVDALLTVGALVFVLGVVLLLVVRRARASHVNERVINVIHGVAGWMLAVWVVALVWGVVRVAVGVVRAFVA